MDTYDSCLKRRSVRKFKQRDIPIHILRKLVDAARVAPSGANVQPIEYIIINEESVCELIFPCLRWAGYIAPEGNPQKGEEPTAYIIILINTKIKDASYQYDVGAACQSISLCAIGSGLATCWMGAIEREQIRKILGIPEYYIIDLAVSIGYPAEEPMMEDLKESVRYYKDKEGVLHVPKRRLQDLLHINRF
jgi:nitroreductase